MGHICHLRRHILALTVIVIAILPGALLAQSNGRSLKDLLGDTYTIVSAGADENGKSLKELLYEAASAPCAGSARVDGVHFVVRPNGKVLHWPRRPIREGDSVVIAVFGAKELMPRLKVQRSSEFQQSGVIRILGEPEAFRAEGGETLKGLKIDPVECEEEKYELRNFAPGEGSVSISAFAGEEDLELGAFDFQVNPLFTGALSFGPVVTFLKDESHTLIPAADGSILDVTSDPVRPLYTLAYTYYLLGKRDLETAPAIGTGATLGLALNAPLENILLGITLDFWNSVYLTSGLHIGRVSRLSPSSGLRDGSAFSGEASALPVIERVQAGHFVGVTFDFRAAAKLLATLTSLALSS